MSAIARMIASISAVVRASPSALAEADCAAVLLSAMTSAAWRMPSTVSEIAALSRSVADRTDETFDTVFSDTNAASTASPSATADTRASSRAVSSMVSTLLETLSSTERMMRSKRRIASSSASRRFFTLSACATSERSRSRSCSERCSTMTARAMSPTSSTRFDPGDLGLPVAARDRAHRLGDLHQRAADALRRPAA